MGVPVFAVDHRPSALGFRSRYAFPILSPDPFAEPDLYVELLLELAKELGTGTPILPTHDPSLNALAQSGAVFGGLYARPFPSGDVVTRIQSKREQLERAVQAGVDIPATAHPTSAEEARAALGRDRLPLARQAVEPRRLPRAFPAPGVPLRERVRARPRLRRRGALRADGAGADSGRRRRAVHRRELHRCRWHRARAVLRSKAQADTARGGHVSCRRGTLGRRGGRRSAPAAPCLRLPRHLAGRVQARSRATAASS